MSAKARRWGYPRRRSSPTAGGLTEQRSVSMTPGQSHPDGQAEALFPADTAASNSVAMADDRLAGSVTAGNQ
jgi:hypothetical protein